MISDSRLRDLEPILEKWRGITQRYFDDESRPPWWNRELTEVGLFASAVWLAGGLALTECKVKKTREGKRGTERADLWFEFHGRTYIAEAKHPEGVLWTYSKAKTRQRLEESLDAAVQEVQAFPRDYRDAARLALVFAHCTANAPRGDASSIPPNFVNGVLAVDCGMRAWVFAERGFERYDGRLHFGTALLGKFVPVR